MPKKQKRYYDEPEFFDAEFDALDGEPEWTADDILDICGATNAAKGLALYQNGGVTERAFDGTTLRATVQDSAGTWPVEFDTVSEGGGCQCPAMTRARNAKAWSLDHFLCEHIASVLYAFTRGPQTFMPQTMGAVVNLLQQNPALR